MGYNQYGVWVDNGQPNYSGQQQTQPAPQSSYPSYTGGGQPAPIQTKPNTEQIQSQITDLQSSTLVSIYSSLYVAVTTPVPVMLTIQNLIDNANAEIKAIKAAQPMKAGAINALWDTTGTQLTIEQQARTTGLSPLPAPRNDNITRFPTTHYSFVDSIPRMALNTSPKPGEMSEFSQPDPSSKEAKTLVDKAKSYVEKHHTEFSGKTDAEAVSYVIEQHVNHQINLNQN